MADQEGPRSAAVILHELGDGSTLADFSAEIQRTVLACERYALDMGSAGKGKVVLTLDLRVEKNGTCAVRAAVTAKVPRAVAPPAAMWVTKGGNLSPENPRQTGLPFRDINQRAAEREIPKESAK